MTSITSILSGRLSHFPIMSILLLGFATMLTMLDIYIRSHKDMKKREEEKNLTHTLTGPLATAQCLQPSRQTSGTALVSEAI